MKVQVHRSRIVNGKLYDKGTHELSDTLAGHWFVSGLIKAGDFTVIEEPKAVKDDAQIKAEADAKAEAELQAEIEAEEKAKAEAEAKAKASKPAPQPQKKGK